MPLFSVRLFARTPRNTAMIAAICGCALLLTLAPAVSAEADGHFYARPASPAARFPSHPRWPGYGQAHRHGYRGYLHHRRGWAPHGHARRGRLHGRVFGQEYGQAFGKAFGKGRGHRRPRGFQASPGQRFNRPPRGYYRDRTGRLFYFGR